VSDSRYDDPVEGPRDDLGRALARIRELEQQIGDLWAEFGKVWTQFEGQGPLLDAAEERITTLERQTPSALQAERELAETLADNAGWDE
jgi:hypothetical protein